ncbi:MAG: hypothetical protein C0478_02010 [Planctomyces sp.]|nr:hypothetical protein [Planctomyces sp.]
MSIIDWLQTHCLSLMSFTAIMVTLLLLGREVQAENGHSQLWHSCRVSVYVLAIIVFFITLAGFLWCEWAVETVGYPEGTPVRVWKFWLDRWYLLYFVTCQPVLFLAFAPASDPTKSKPR